MIAGARSRVVRAGELDVHVWEAGHGQAMVLLHGGTATAEMSWTSSMPRLAERWRVVAPDTRGHGRTPNPSDDLSYAQLADDVAALVDALDLDQPIVTGYSDGAQTALEFGLRHPGRAAALVLGGTMSEPTATYVTGLHEWGFTAPGEVDLDRIGVEFGDELASLRTAHIHASSDHEWLRFLQQISQLWLTLPHYDDQRLAMVTDPTLVITGDRDELADVEQAERLFRSISDAELAIVPERPTAQPIAASTGRSSSTSSTRRGTQLDWFCAGPPRTLSSERRRAVGPRLVSRPAYPTGLVERWAGPPVQASRGTPLLRPRHAGTDRHGNPEGDVLGHGADGQSREDTRELHRQRLHGQDGCALGRGHGTVEKVADQRPGDAVQRVRTPPGRWP